MMLRGSVTPIYQSHWSDMITPNTLMMQNQSDVDPDDIGMHRNVTGRQSDDIWYMTLKTLIPI